MAKKPMTKGQIVSHFAEKFELTKKSASGIIDEVVALAISETNKAGSFTLPGIGKLVLVNRRKIGISQYRLQYFGLDTLTNSTFDLIMTLHTS